MNTPEQTTMSRRNTMLLLASSVLPVIAYVLVRQLGLMSLARLGAMGVIALAAGILLLTRPRLGIYFMVVYLYANLRFYISPKVAVAVMGVITVSVLLEFVRGRSYRAPDSAFSWSSVLLFMIALQSMLWAHYMGDSLAAFSKLAKALLLTVLVVQLIETPEQLRSMGRLIFAGALATIIFGVVNLKLGVKQDINIFGGVNVIRFMGTHTNPNYAAAFMTSALPVGVFFVKHGRGRLAKAAAAVGVVTIVVGVFSTYSRAALLSLAAVALGILVREVRSRKAYSIVLVVLLVGLILTPRFYWARVLAIADLSQAIRRDWSFFLRYSAMSEAWELFLRHPFLGVGLNNFLDRSATGFFVRIGTHNMYLSLLTGVGLVGFFTYLAVQISVMRDLVSGWRHRWSPERYWLGDFSYYLLLALVSTLLSGFFADLEFHYMIWIPISCALVVGCLRRGGSSGESPVVAASDRIEGRQ
jgi:O-antigen ligase